MDKEIIKRKPRRKIERIIGEYFRLAFVLYIKKENIELIKNMEVKKI